MINFKTVLDLPLNWNVYSKVRKEESKKELAVEAKEFTPVWVMSKTATIEITQIGTVIGSVLFKAEHANVEVCVPVAGNGIEDT